MFAVTNFWSHTVEAPPWIRLFQERVPGVTGETMSGIDASKRMRTGGGDYSPTPYAPSYPAQGLQASAPSWGPQRYLSIPRNGFKFWDPLHVTSVLRRCI